MSADELVANRGVERALKAGVARVLRGSDPDFEDAVQDGWLILLRQRDMRHPVAVAFHVGRSAAVEISRKRKRRVATVDLDEVPSALADRPTDRAPFVRERVTRAIRDLPAGQRRIFVRTALLGYSLADVARDAGLHPGSARSQAFKARRHLQRALAELGPARPEYTAGQHREVA